MIPDRTQQAAAGFVSDGDRRMVAREGEASPPAPPHTTIVRTDREPSEVVVRFEPSSTRWHKVLNALWDDGVIASLPDSAFRVLGALLRLKAGEDVPVHAPVEILCVLTGRKPSAVYDGRASLLSHPAGLLAMPGRDLYSVLPSWGWAGRSGPDGAGDVPAGRRVFRDGGMPHAPPVRNGGKFSASAESGASGSKEARARVSNQKLRIDVDDDSVMDERVRMLLTAGPRPMDRPFDRADAERLVASSGCSVEQVRTALRNAWAMATAGKVKNWRGYVRTLVVRGCTLFDHLARRDDDVQRVAQLLQGMIGEGLLDEEAQRVLNAWWARATDEQRAGLIPRDFRAQRHGGDGGTGADRWLLAVNRVLKNHAEE